MFAASTTIVVSLLGHEPPSFCADRVVCVKVVVEEGSRGPSCGSRGIVLLAFEDNRSSKIGASFDKSVPDGNDLGGLCEDRHASRTPM
ncbi:hypothetical protein RIF29_28601 [Crotalaria pallida]|uniref:Uncharacterized protein n=1 Tax=Crotalaria pallida TaxID=3830 RepID=A0AAN9ECY6_CROPI